MPPKASFRVNLSEYQKENAPPLPLTTSFALPGTLADVKFRRKSQRELGFSNSQIQKTRLATWDFNISTQHALPNQSSTMFTNGMPTPQTPPRTLEMGYTMEADGASYAAWEETFPQ